MFKIVNLFFLVSCIALLTSCAASFVQPTLSYDFGASAVNKCNKKYNGEDLSACMGAAIAAKDAYRQLFATYEFANKKAAKWKIIHISNEIGHLCTKKKSGLYTPCTDGARCVTEELYRLLNLERDMWLCD